MALAENPSPAPRKILLTVDDELKRRMVATLAWTAGRTGISTQQEFIRAAIAAACQRLEDAHNNGQPFPTGGDAAHE
jgi:hypothetical protein